MEKGEDKIGKKRTQIDIYITITRAHTPTTAGVDSGGGGHHQTRDSNSSPGDTVTSYQHRLCCENSFHRASLPTSPTMLAGGGPC